jgi:2-polyprenyl-3-methyl-5-hydroxy-6-metoxy-1,4-benzoquinol methylase
MESTVVDKLQLNNIATFYEQDRFGLVLVKKTAEIIVPRIRGKQTLEMGCSLLTMSKQLAVAAASLEIVEGARRFVVLAQQQLPGVAVYHSLFEEFEPEKTYEAIVLGNTLHHIQEPGRLLERIRTWLAPGGCLYLTVPNMFSLHRRMGVKMGKLQDVFDTTERNEAFAQPGRFTKETLGLLLQESGFSILSSFGFFLKPFSDAQMESLNLPEEAINALCELGMEFEELACQIYVESTPLHAT